MAPPDADCVIWLHVRYADGDGRRDRVQVCIHGDGVADDVYIVSAG